MNYIGLIFTKLTPNITTDKDIEKSKYIIYATIHPCMKAAHRTVVFIVYSYKWWCHYRNHFCQDLITGMIWLWFNYFLNSRLWECMNLKFGPLLEKDVYKWIILISYSAFDLHHSQLLSIRLHYTSLIQCWN